MQDGTSSARQPQSTSYLVVLTATVTPAHGANVHRSDPNVRRQDYAQALRFWLGHPDPRLNRILFIENSNDDLSFFQNIADNENVFGKDVELISTAPGAIPPGISYGWGELRMLDEGLERSRLVQSVSHIIKATGRLVFPSITRLLDRTPLDSDAMVECRIPTSAYRKGLNFFPALLTRKNAYASTQLIIVSRALYADSLRGMYKTMTAERRNDSFEALLYKRLRAAQNTRRISWRFPVNCEPSGVSGVHNTSYDKFSRKVIRVARAALRGTGIWL